MTALSAGSVNGSDSEPGPGTRLVVDEQNNLSIADGLMTIVGTHTPPSLKDPLISFPGVARAPGRALIMHANQVGVGKTWVGWSQSNSTRPLYSAISPDSGTLVFSDGEAAINTNVGTYLTGTDMHFAFVLRSAGSFVFEKAATENWKLLYSYSGGTATPLYPAALGYTTGIASGFVRVPSALWLPVPLASDNFAVSFGTTNGFGNKEGRVRGVCLGDSQCLLGTDKFNTAGNAFAVIDNKGIGGQTLSQIAARFARDVTANTTLPGFVVIVGGINDILYYVPLATMQSKIREIVAHANLAGITPVLVSIWPCGNASGWTPVHQAVLDIYNKWLVSYAASNSITLLDAYDLLEDKTDPDKLNPYYGLADGLHLSAAGYTAVGELLFQTLPIGTGVFVPTGLGAGGSGLAWTNRAGTWGISGGKAIALTTNGGIAISTVPSSTADVLVSADLTRSRGKVGTIVRWTDANNYLYAYHDGTNAALIKVVEGNPSFAAGPTEAEYVAGAQLRVIAEGTDVSLYYNHVQIGSTATVTGFAGTAHGIYADNTTDTLGNFTLYARGTGNEYAVLDDLMYYDGLYTLNTYIRGDGTITSSPAGIDCNSKCAAPFAPNSAVTLTAAPAPGFTFAYWSGACSGASTTCNLSMTTHTSVTAVFDPVETKKCKLTVARRKVNRGDGTITSDDGTINCGGDCAETYYPGRPVTLTAVAAPNSTFTGWGSPCTGTGTCVVTVDKARTVRATFTGPQKLTVSKQKVRKGDGTVTSSPPGITCGAACSWYYPLHQSVTLTATASEGSIFTGWKPASLNCPGTEDCEITMDKARSAIAVFTKPGR